MDNELKPCLFNIGDKVKHVDVGNRSAETIIGCVINRYGEYEYTLAESIENGYPVYITTGVDEGFLTLVDITRPALCPDTLEAAAKVADEHSEDCWTMGSESLSVSQGRNKASKHIAQKIRKLKGEL